MTDSTLLLGTDIVVVTIMWRYVCGMYMWCLHTGGFMIGIHLESSSSSSSIESYIRNFNSENQCLSPGTYIHTSYMNFTYIDK